MRIGPDGLLSLVWTIGALGSVILAVSHFPFALAAALCCGWPLAFAFPAILVVQAAVCLTWVPARSYGRPLVLAVLAVMGALLTASQGGLASVVWPGYAPYLWLLWIGPIPMLVPGLMELTAALTRRRR
jgi:hypothetical protein